MAFGKESNSIGYYTPSGAFHTKHGAHEQPKLPEGITNISNNSLAANSKEAYHQYASRQQDEFLEDKQPEIIEKFDHLAVEQIIKDKDWHEHDAEPKNSKKNKLSSRERELARGHEFQEEEPDV